jgi:RNA-splicing ligase RtcB
METVKLIKKNVDFAKLDALIRREIPSGRDVRTTAHPYAKQINLQELRCAKAVNLERARLSIGTLGGGNHFIELNRNEDGALYLVVHSGSRHIGTEVADYYQKIACKSAVSMPRDLAYVSGGDFDDYIHDMKLIQRFAVLNRQAMAEVILRGMGWDEAERFTTIHNYIDTDMMILRKGAVSAKKGERLLIPVNMRDGSLICEGKSNAEWNFSAPHGAGRLMSRKAALKNLSMEEYTNGMKGIFTTSVNRHTLDESPMAYKSMDDIVRFIGPTAEITAHIRPLYNFKASE